MTKRKLKDAPMQQKSSKRVRTKEEGLLSEEVCTDSKPHGEENVTASILDSLRGSHPVEALKVFASSVESNYQTVSQFVSLGGQSSDLLRLLQQGEEKAKAPDVSIVFNAVEALFLFVAQSEDDKKCRTLTVDVMRKILQEHLSFVMNLLSPTNTAYQAKSVLRMLTAMVACGDPLFAREILLKLDFEHKHFEGLLKRRSQDAAVDVRTSFVHLLIAFLINGNAFVIKEFLDRKTKFAQVFPGLVEDSCVTVEFVLMALTEKVAENPNLSKTSKMKLFGVNNLRPLLALFEWRGPRKVKEADGTDDEEEHKEELERIVAATKKFFTKILTSTKLGIIFHDPTCGNSGKNLNHLLQNLLQSMPEPWSKPHLTELVISALTVSPDQLRPYLVSLERVWAPRMSDQWIQLADFVRDLLRSLRWSDIISGLDEKQPKLIVSVLTNLSIPEKFMRDVVWPALQDESAVVRRKGIELLHVLLQNASNGFQETCDQVRRQVLGRILERMPTVGTLQKFWELEFAESEDIEGQALLHFAKVLDTLMRNYPHKYSASVDFDVPKMMQQLQKMDGPESKELASAKLSLMKQMCEQKHIYLLKEEHSLLLIKAFVNAADEEAKHLSLQLLHTMLASVGFTDANCLRVWLHFISKAKDCDSVMSIISKCVIAAAEDVDAAKTKSLELTKKYSAAAHSFSPLTVAMLENEKIRGQPVEYLEKVIIALIHLQDDVTPFCSYLDDLQLKLKKVDRATNQVKKGKLSSVTIALSDDSSDYFSVYLQILQHLAAFKCGGGDDGSFQALSKMLENMLDNDNRQRIINDLLDTPTGEMLFQPFDAQLGEAATFAVSQLLSTRPPRENENYKILFMQQCETKLNSSKDEDLLRSAFGMFSYTAEELSTLAKLAVGETKKVSRPSVCLLACILAHMARQRIEVSPEMEKTSLSKLHKHLQLVLRHHEELPSSVAFYQALAQFVRYCPRLSTIFPTSTISECWEQIQDGTVELVVALTSVAAAHAAAFRQFILKASDVEALHFSSILLVLCSALEAHHPIDNLELSSLHTKLKMVFKSFLDKGETQEGCEEHACRIVEVLCGHYKFQFGKMKSDFVPKSVQQLRGRLAVAEAKGSALFNSFVLLRGMQFAATSTKKLVEQQRKALELFEVLGRCLDSEIDANITQFRGENHESWIQFVKIALKYGLKVGGGGGVGLKSACLKTLRRLCLKVYSDIGDETVALEEVQMIAAMIFGHSCFMQTMLDSESPHCSVKCELSNLLLALMRLNPGICAAANVPIFLGAYLGTLSASDQAILQILDLHERNNVPLGQYYPIMFGQSAVSHYSVRQNDGAAALWKRPKTSEILSLIEPERMLRSAVNFPVDLALAPAPAAAKLSNEAFYDPRFFLPLCSQICSPGVFVDRHLKIVDSGLLALTFGSLSSRDPPMRAVGYVVLSRVFHQLETAKLTAEKRIWLHLIDMVRNGVRAAKGDHKLRLPPIVSTFLIRATMILHSPLDPMYKAISSFVLAKPTLDLFNVPEFLRLFHSKELGHTEERNWILAVLRDGMKSEIDYQIAQKDYVFKMMMAFHGSILADTTTKSLIRQIILSSVKVTQAAFPLVKHHGLNLWIIAELAKKEEDYETTVIEMLEIVQVAYRTMQDSLAPGARLPSTIIYEFQMVLDVLALKQVPPSDTLKHLRAQVDDSCQV